MDQPPNRTDGATPEPPGQGGDHASSERPSYIDQEVIDLFIAETLDHLSSIEASVLALEESGDDIEALEEVFRLFHTIKGNAGPLGFPDIEELAHASEDLLHRARSGEHHIGAREVELIFAAVDLLSAMTAAAQAPPSTEAPTDFASRRHAIKESITQLLQGAPAPGHAEPDASPMDDEEAVADSSSRSEGEDGRHLMSRASETELARPTIKVDTHKLDGLVDLIGELVIVQQMIHQHSSVLSSGDDRLNRTLAQCQRLTQEVHQGAMAMRLVPIRRTFQRMQRLVRDLSRRSGKPLDLAIAGEEIELDRKLVDEIADPLMHMLRNCVDHGIEDPETRSRAGKPVRGQLAISAEHQSGSVLIKVSDDGRGLDTDRLLERARAAGLVESGVRPPDAELHPLIFRSGFTTATHVTEISGRGVGMDVVRRSVESLRGRIEIRSQRGAGTTLLIKLPLTLATIEGLVLGVSGQRYVVPTFSVQESLRPTPERLRAIGQGWSMEVRNQLIPVIRLADLFDIRGAETNPLEAVVIVIDDSGRRIALMVDQLLGKQNLVIKTLGETFAGVKGVAGGAVMGDGRIGLILDADGLIGLCEQERPVHAA